MKPTVDTILDQLVALGVRQGDVLFVTADLMQVGLFFKSRKETMRAWVDLLSCAVGTEGTIIVAAYTPVFFRFKKDARVVFTPQVASTSGALSNALLRDPRSKRSRHPTNSCIAIGRDAEEILTGHDHNSQTYSVLGEIVRRGGKHLMLGTLDRKNAPLAFHYAQELLGITRFEPTVGIFQSYYLDEYGQQQLFTKWNTGGCSSGGYKLLGPLIVDDAISLGRVGQCQAALIDAKKSTTIAYSILSADRSALICDNLLCLSCRGRWTVSGLKTPVIYFKIIFIKLFKIIKSSVNFGS
jgi:aminoglycoside 3-N-acetyltransferase